MLQHFFPAHGIDKGNFQPCQLNVGRDEVYTLSLIRQAYGKHIKVFGQTIPHSVRAAEISAAGKSIFVHDPKGKVAEAYKSLTKEVLADAEKQRKRQSEQLR